MVEIEDRRHLFISYATENHELADWLSLRLAAEGYEIWYDRIKLLGGESYPKDIDDAIKNKTFRVLHLLSRESVRKDNPVKERTLALNIARERNIDFLIPLNVDGLRATELPWMTADLTYIPFKDDWAGGLEKLLKKLDSIGALKQPRQGRDEVRHFFADQGLVQPEPEPIWSNVVEVLEFPQSVYRLTPQQGVTIPWNPEPIFFAHGESFWAFELPAEKAGLDIERFDCNPDMAVGNLPLLNPITNLVSGHLIRHARGRGLRFTGRRNELFFPPGLTPNGRLSFQVPGSRRSWTAATGERTFVTNRMKEKSRYHLSFELKPVLRIFEKPVVEICQGVSPAPTTSQAVMVDQRGKKTTYDFDSGGRMARATNHDGKARTYTYNDDLRRTCVTDELGHKTGFNWDNKGNLTGVIDAENTNSSCTLKSGGVKWTYAYTARNDVDLETDPLGRQADYLYDSNGNLTEVSRKDSSGSTKLRTCFTVPASGQNKGLVTEIIESTTLSDCTGNKTIVEYDQYGNQTAVIDPRFSGLGSPPKTTMSYDLGGRRLTVTNELGHTTTFTYDSQNRVLTAKDNLDNTTVNTYDAKGNLLTITDANGKPTTYSYDQGDRLVSVEDAAGGVTAYTYDPVGNRVAVTNANREVVGPPESGAACGNTGTGDGVDNDGDGVVDDGCASMQYAYDNVGRLSSQRDALGNTWSYGYDDAGRLTSRTDPKGQVTAYGYNLRNDLTSVNYPPGTADVTFQYNAVGSRTQMVDGTGTTTYEYDALNRLTSVGFPGSRTVGYGYDNAGNRTSTTYPGGSNQVTYGYDEAGNLTSVRDWNSQQTNYGYNSAGRLTTVTLPSGTGVVGTYSYDNADRLTGISWAKGANTLASAGYTLDAVGNRTQRTDSLGTHVYAYDNLYRLTGADYPGADNTTYTYDAAGNRKTMVTAEGNTQYAYDAADRVASVTPPGGSPVTYTWDANGNLTARGADTFGWDAEDRLTSATTGGVAMTFAYNGDGLRNSRTTGGNTTTFTWDVNTSVPQVLDDGSLKFVYGIGRIARVDAGGGTHYFLPDALGSTMALIDSAGNVVNTYDYDVFGAIRGSSGSQPNEFTFTGEQQDESTGLEYLRARYYDQDTGRFLSRDALSGSIGQPGTQNRFVYGLDNPALFADPLGLCGFLDLKCYYDEAEREVQTFVSAYDSGYLEINFTYCGFEAILCGTVGVQFSRDQSLHIYGGAGIGYPGGGVSLNAYPNQSISEGVSCSVGATAAPGIVGPVGTGASIEAGASAEGGSFLGGGPYVGTSGTTVTCYYVFNSSGVFYVDSTGLISAIEPAIDLELSSSYLPYIQKE